MVLNAALLTQKNWRCPDFVHNCSKQGLWIDRRSNPPWVASRLMSLNQGRFGKVEDYAGEVAPQTLIRLCSMGELGDALQAVDFAMQHNMHASTDAFYCLLEGCITCNDVQAGRFVHTLIRRCGLDSNTFLRSHLIRMYASCGSLLEANEIFRNTHEKTVYLWSTAILAHANLGHGDEAIWMYQEMQHSSIEPNGHIFVAVLKACANMANLKQGKCVHNDIIHTSASLSSFVGNTLVDMYIKCGALEDARKVFGSLPERTFVTCAIMISGFAQQGHASTALECFEQMIKVGLEPNSTVFVSALKACSSSAAMDHGKLLHLQIIEAGLDSDVMVGSSLIDMYANCGTLKDACNVFNRMRDQDSISWTSMIEAFAMHNDHKSALGCFWKMQQEGLKPDGVTYVCLLSVCCHLGLVGEGFQHFESMIRDHGIKPTLSHYGCLGDLLCRAGYLKHAQELLDVTPFESNVVGWTSLLSSCRMYGDLTLGRQSLIAWLR